jgi:ketosteroid isomerase-like protein
MLLLTGYIMLLNTVLISSPDNTIKNTPLILNHSTIMRNINDSLELSAINAQFIRNFITQDVKAHDKIIHQDFVCIESNGSIVSRATYLKNWATDYDQSGCISFTYSDEHIRIFGDIAFVRSKTTAVRKINGKSTTSHTIYTDSYKKENGKWKCIQVQITPVK